jgi:capsular exopolysaccharide synthesis family protein
VNPTPFKLSADAHHDRIDFRAIYYLLREKAWLISLCFLLAAFGTAAHLMRAPKIYAARVVLQLEQEEAKVINIQRVQQEDLQSLESLKTVEQTLQNPAILARVIDANKLATDPRFVPPGSETQPSREQLVNRLSKMVEVRLRKGTRLIDIRVEHTDPSLTALVANSIVREFLLQNQEHTASSSDIATEFLVKEAQELKHKLEASESLFQSFKEQIKVSSLEDRQHVVLEKLKDLGAKVTEAKSQRIMQETAWRQVTALSNDVNALFVVPAVANDQAVVEIRSSIAKLESDVANLRQRYKPLHPKFIQAQSQLTEWKSALRRAIVAVPQRVRSAYESALVGEQALEAELKAQDTIALELNKLSVRYNVLARDVEADRALYQSVLNRMKETFVTKDLKPSKVRLIQEATVPEKPIRPEKVRVILTGIMAGLAISILLVLLLNAIDRSLKTVDQTEEYLTLPVLSTVPKFSGAAGEQRKFIVSDDVRSPEAESFRTLRTALSMLGRKEDRRVFLFTSALPSEGKTFCSLNFSISLARQGLRTLVVDCDLRRPMVDKSLRQEGGRNFGLTDYLTGQKTFDEAIHSGGIDNFFYMPSGTDTPNPAELLAKNGIDGVIDEALKHFDRVVVDSAPIHAVSDTLLILNRIQTLCLVIRSRKTPKNSILRAVRILRQAEAPLVGVILNMMPRNSDGYYYYDYAYHGKYAEKDERRVA